MIYTLEIPDDYSMTRFNWKNIFACSEKKCNYRTIDAVMLIKHIWQEHHSLPSGEVRRVSRQNSATTS